MDGYWTIVGAGCLWSVLRNYDRNYNEWLDVLVSIETPVLALLIIIGLLT